MFNPMKKLALTPVSPLKTVVYTDGACSSNGCLGAKAGVGVYWGDDHPDNVAEPLTSGPQTNNRAEYQAVVRALEIAIERKYENLQIRTDSNLLVKSMTQWLPSWKRKGWKTSQGMDVKNRDLLERIDHLTKKLHVEFTHVAGHSGIEGNEKADRLAVLGAAMNSGNY